MIATVKVENTHHHTLTATLRNKYLQVNVEGTYNKSTRCEFSNDGDGRRSSLIPWINFFLFYNIILYIFIMHFICDYTYHCFNYMFMAISFGLFYIIYQIEKQESQAYLFTSTLKLEAVAEVV